VKKYSNQKWEELQKRQKVKDDFDRLDQQRIDIYISNPMEGNQVPVIPDELKKELDIISKELESLPKISFTPDDLNKDLIRVTNLMLEAAKFEGLENVIKEQQVLAFKADTTMEKWRALKFSFNDEEWDKIKGDLVVFVLKRDDKPQEKVQLLMKDGLFQHCIDIFPKPTGDKESKELDLLYELYDTIERNQPKFLEPLLRIVGQYMRRYFILQDYTAMDKIFNRLQKRFPSVIKRLYEQAADLVLLTLTRSHYEEFVDGVLKNLKQRLEDLNRPEDWKHFVDTMFVNHSGKKKIITLCAVVKRWAI